LNIAARSTDAEIVVTLPVPHIDQLRAFEAMHWYGPDPVRFSIVRCGRRWGKTELLGTIGCTDVANGKYVGYFAPDYKRMLPFYKFCAKKLLPITISSSQQSGIITAIGGGSLEHWTLNDSHAGRSRKYHTVLIDEAAFAGPEMMDIWRNAIKPTLLDYNGRCIVASNTNGIDQEQWFWKICHGQMEGTVFQEFHAPSSGNPYLPKEELADLEKNEHPLVWQQEYEAKFVDWSGDAFFRIEDLLVEKAPIDNPKRVDGIFCTIDTATKTGRENDATAVIYWAWNKIGDNFPLIILDWDITQIEGAHLETWLPGVLDNCEEFARKFNSRGGVAGAFIEDKASGMVLLQNAERRWPGRAHAISADLTALGKDGRALNVSGYVTRGKIKITKHAHDKVVVYKKTSRNHLTSQVSGYRYADKNPSREDDLLDAFCYGPAIALGNPEGF
jgi:hypothetical protein